MPKEKPPRRRLIAPDSDDEASAETGAEATKEPEEGEDPEAEEELLEGEVDFKSIAARLRTTIAVPDDDTPVAPDAWTRRARASEARREVRHPGARNEKCRCSFPRNETPRNTTLNDRSFAPEKTRKMRDIDVLFIPDGTPRCAWR